MEKGRWCYHHRLNIDVVMDILSTPLHPFTEINAVQREPLVRTRISRQGTWDHINNRWSHATGMEESGTTSEDSNLKTGYILAAPSLRLATNDLTDH